MHRLYCLYSTEVTTTGEAVETTGLTASFVTPGEFRAALGDPPDEDRMDDAFRRAQAQMPLLLGRRHVARLTLPPGPGGGARGPLSCDLAALVMPYGGVVLCVSIDLDGDLEALVEVLQSTTSRWSELTFDGLDLAGAAATLPAVAPLLPALRLGGDVHHVLHVDDAQMGLFDPDGTAAAAEGGEHGPPGDVRGDAVSALVFRTLHPLRQGYAEVRYPIASNRSPGTLVAVGPAVTVLGGDIRRIEGWLLWSGIQLISALSRLRQIRRDAYATLTEMEEGLQDERNHLGDHVLVRRHLAELARRLGRLELELAFGVEAYVDIQFVLPSPMLAEYHRAAAALIGLVNGVETTADLLDRATKAADARREVIRTAERATDEVRVQRVTVVAGTLSVVALVTSIFFGFFGSNAFPVEPGRPSYFSAVYLAFYGALVLVLGGIGTLYWGIKRRYPLRTDTQELASWGLVRDVPGRPRRTVLRKAGPRPRT